MNLGFARVTASLVQGCTRQGALSLDGEWRAVASDEKGEMQILRESYSRSPEHYPLYYFCHVVKDYKAGGLEGKPHQYGLTRIISSISKTNFMHYNEK